MRHNRRQTGPVGSTTLGVVSMAQQGCLFVGVGAGVGVGVGVPVGLGARLDDGRGGFASQSKSAIVKALSQENDISQGIVHGQDNLL